jgi:sugar fermentation stimulation protein A
VGVNTNTPNRLVCDSLRAGRVRQLAGYSSIRREVSVASGTRIDIALEDDSQTACFVEVKNCTLVENGVARFPDAVTARGRRHLVELSRLVSEGFRCAMFYLIQRTDAEMFTSAADIDPEYSRQLVQAAAAGVEVLAYDVTIDLSGISLHRSLPIRISRN